MKKKLLYDFYKLYPHFGVEVILYSQSSDCLLYVCPLSWSITEGEKSVLHWPGIEPGPPAWQARILPLNHQCIAVCVLGGGA